MDSSSVPQILIERQQVQLAVEKLASEIGQDYQERDLVLVCVLKGAFVFTSDLARLLENLSLEVDFIGLSSYCNNRESSGEVKITQPLSCSIKGRDVLVVEDIVDTGITTRFLLDYLAKEKPASLKLCALLDKTSRRQTAINIDYKGLEVPDKFIVGYGLDCAEKYRHLPDICFLEDK